MALHRAVVECSLALQFIKALLLRRRIMVHLHTARAYHTLILGTVSPSVTVCLHLLLTLLPIGFSATWQSADL